ncbi:MAG: pyrroline-5-carboxylate reductase [Oscillibacter sp.]|nr:pyrroline-5-carboxylate reductase [Oscillibacter sp.]
MKMAGFIGCGNMGGILAAAASTRIGEWEIMGADHHPEKTEQLWKEYGVIPATAAEIAEKCGLIFLGVKPQSMRQTAEEIQKALVDRSEPFTLVSMAAGLSTATVSELFTGVADGCSVIRIMPNTAASVGEAVILYCSNAETEPDTESGLIDLLSPAGNVVKVEEPRMNAASAVTGCGPAFVCMFLEAMTEGAVECGLPRAQAEQFVLKTVLGTAQLTLKTGQNPALLRAAVCSPAGSTIAGVSELEKHAFRFTVMEAVRAAFERTRELGN